MIYLRKYYFAVDTYNPKNKALNNFLSKLIEKSLTIFHYGVILTFFLQVCVVAFLGLWISTDIAVSSIVFAEVRHCFRTLWASSSHESSIRLRSGDCGGHIVF